MHYRPLSIAASDLPPACPRALIVIHRVVVQPESRAYRPEGIIRLILNTRYIIYQYGYSSTVVCTTWRIFDKTLQRVKIGIADD